MDSLCPEDDREVPEEVGGWVDGRAKAVSGRHQAREQEPPPVPAADHLYSVRGVETHYVVELHTNTDGLADRMIVMAGYQR